LPEPNLGIGFALQHWLISWRRAEALPKFSTPPDAKKGKSTLIHFKIAPLSASD
jgi:hypothetical protein